MNVWERLRMGACLAAPDTDRGDSETDSASRPEPAVEICDELKAAILALEAGWLGHPHIVLPGRGVLPFDQIEQLRERLQRALSRWMHAAHPGLGVLPARIVVHRGSDSEPVVVAATRRFGRTVRPRQVEVGDRWLARRCWPSSGGAALELRLTVWDRLREPWPVDEDAVQPAPRPVGSPP